MQVAKTKDQTSTSEYYAFRNINFITRASYNVRKKIYDVFYERFSGAEKIADVGVTSELASPEANLLEALFPHKEKITAIGVEDAQDLEKKYPGLKFVRVEPNQPLPFPNSYFDVVYSHAVVEHIVRDEDRTFFLKELIRVGKNVFLTTPNKYFPIEPHTFVPILHFAWPRLFYFLLDKKIANKFYNAKNLKLLNRSDLSRLARSIPNTKFEIRTVKLFGVVSNLILILEKL